MSKPVETAFVKLWGHTVGAVSWHPRGYAEFEYDPAFIQRGWEVSPLQMPLAEGKIYPFPALNKITFKGLPGMLADSLPDKFGNAIIDNWLATEGRHPESFSPIERLCYTGTRGMGALEYHPVLNDRLKEAVSVEVGRLVALAQDIMASRTDLHVQVRGADKDDHEALVDILRVGTSAGGARPKAVIAMDKKGNVVSGQTAAPKGYEHWLLKFDGVKDTEFGKTDGKGRVEYAYYLMARAAGIHMADCRLLEENGRAHFMTRRFDRIGNEKIHMQTLCGLDHLDFNARNGYEQAFQAMRKLQLPTAEQAELYRRMVFNVLARNHDDHTKNISFLMDKHGQWSLSPAYDVTFNYKPGGQWTNVHQMSVGGKQDNFVLPDDLIQVGQKLGIPKALDIYQQVHEAVRDWLAFAKEADINSETAQVINGYLRIPG